MTQNLSLNGVELLSASIGYSTDDFIKSIDKEPKKLVEMIRRSGITDSELRLSKPLKRPGNGSNAALVSEGIVLWPHLDRVIEEVLPQYEKEKRIEKIWFEYDADAIEFSRSKIVAHIKSLIKGINDEEKFGHFASDNKTTEAMKMVERSLDHAIDSILKQRTPETPKFATGLIACMNEDNPIIQEMVNSALFSVYALKHTGYAAMIQDNDPFMIVSKICLLKDLPFLLEEGVANKPPKDILITAAQYADMLGSREIVKATIPTLLRYTDNKGNPTYSKDSCFTPNRYQKVVDAVHYLMMMVNPKRSNMSLMDSAYRLQMYAFSQYIDDNVAKALGKMLVGDMKTEFFKRITNEWIPKTCKHYPGHKPIAFDMSAERLPTSFICNMEGCPNLTPEVTTTINREQDGLSVGTYHKCQPLTVALGKFYKDMKTRKKK